MTNKTKKQMNKAEMKKAKGGLISVAIIAAHTVDKPRKNSQSLDVLRKNDTSPKITDAGGVLVAD
jgi:hypothetical protein